MIAASDVAVATRSSKPSQRTSSGTITVPPPTPSSPENRPARVPITPSWSVRRLGMRGILGRVPPVQTLAEALQALREEPSRAAILLDVDGTLAPIVRHADDALVPEATRMRLIEVSRVYALVACVSGRRAAVARRIVSIGSIAYVGNHGGEILRPGGTEPEVDPDFARAGERGRRGVRAAGGAAPRLPRAGVDRRAHPPAGARRGQGRDRRLPLARRAGRG